MMFETVSLAQPETMIPWADEAEADEAEADEADGADRAKLCGLTWCAGGRMPFPSLPPLLPLPA